MAEEAAAATDAHATTRQRRDGRCPVGKSRRRSGTSAAIGIHNQVWNHAAISPPGRDPGAVTRDRAAYCVANRPDARLSPKPRRIHPTALPDLAAITAPAAAVR